MPDRRKLTRITGDYMIIQDALLKGTEILKEANIEAPVVEAGVILCHVLDCDKSYLYTHGDKSMDVCKYNDYLSKIISRSKGLPVQYITGCQEFMSLNFNVTPDTLIPRHDTEVLVEVVIEHVKAMRGTTKADAKPEFSAISHQPSADGSSLSILNSQPSALSSQPLALNHQPSTLNAKLSTTDEVRVLDIGTGSGCIAISLAYYLEHCHVTAIDISHGALEVAKSNAKKIGVADKVRFIERDIFKGLEDFQAEASYFDIIVSNPPYIPHPDISGLQIEVKEHEPITALDGGYDGLDFYREITRNCQRYLKPGGLLAFEVGYDQASSVCAIMGKWFYDISTVKDISAIDRVVKGLLR